MAVPLILALFGSYGALLLIAVVIVEAVVVDRVERHELQQIEANLRIKALLVEQTVRIAGGGEWQDRAADLGRETGMRITLIAADGRVLADSDKDPRRHTIENHDTRPEVVKARSDRFGSDTRRSETVGQPLMYVALRTDLPAPAPAFVRVALPLDEVQEQLAQLRRILWTAAAGTTVAAVGLAFWLVRRMARPLQELTAGAEHIAGGNYGSKVYVASPDEFGTLARAFNFMSDRLAAQFAQLEDDRQQLRAVLSGMEEGVVALDADQRILFANECAVQMLELSAIPVAGRKLWEVVRHRPIQEIVQSCLAQSECKCREVTWNAQEQKSLTVHVTQLHGFPPREAVLVLHDTTELRRLERLRQDFVANVSHELKTPLSVIKACIETLLDGAVEDPENRGPFLEQVGEQADRLHTLILDLLSLARIESGTEVFAPEAVPVDEAVAHRLERHHARAEAKHQQLELVPPGVRIGEITAWVDEEALGQILDNLVDNAVKYTPAEGRIRVRWWEEDGQVCLEVEDTGIGIPERDLPRVFERFYRVDKVRSRELGGTGLGLSIVKHLVQAMNGTIRATSRLG